MGDGKRFSALGVAWGIVAFAVIAVVFGTWAARARDPDRADACATAATFTERWPGELAAGMTIGPVTLVLPKDANTSGFRLSETPGSAGLLQLKIQIQLDSPSGVAFTISGKHDDTGAPARFTHMDEGATVPARAQPPHRENPGLPALVPGAMLVAEPGCYQVWVEVDRERFGPWGILIQRSEG